LLFSRKIRVSRFVWLVGLTEVRSFNVSKILRPSDVAAIVCVIGCIGSILTVGSFLLGVSAGRVGYCRRGADIQAVTKPNGKMIARMRTYFTQPETLVFPLAAAPIGKGFPGVLHNMNADLSGRASVSPTIPRKIAILSRMRDY
jgi:hypothetical protein